LYTAIIDVRVPGGRQMLLDDRDTYYRELQKGAMAQVTAAGLDVQALAIEGEEVQTLVDRIVEYNLDLLVLGRRHHSTVSELWSEPFTTSPKKSAATFWRFTDPSRTLRPTIPFGSTSAATVRTVYKVGFRKAARSTTPVITLATPPPVTSFTPVTPMKPKTVCFLSGS
jgi:hypothetical protein